ncbi:MAG: Na+/H+ antiporter [Anaerolineales bacterium]|nr:Na+/H+ antiporter [Anaerolineales bacterium]
MGILEIEELVITLLFVATLVGILVKRLRMPYTVGLVIVGLALAVANPLLNITQPDIVTGLLRGLLVPQLILGLLVPPLVFEAAFHIRFAELRRNLPIILVFAIPGVVLTMLMVGGVVAWGTNLALPVALVFGALIAATDPVAVVALFRSLGVPKRLQILLEGESLFNDGTAIVVFNLMLSVVATGEFSLVESLLDFVVVAGGGLIVGILVATIMARIIHFIDAPLLEITITTVVAFGSYLVAEHFHLSGVLAVVAAGLVTGNISSRGMSPTTRIALYNFWEYAAFLANSFVFLLIGLVIDLNSVIANWRAILLAIAAVLVGRAVVIYLFSLLKRNIEMRTRHVLYWGGLRGAISLALALSLPQTLGDDLILLHAMTFGVVLFTLLGQGPTMEPLVKALKFMQSTPTEEEYQRRQARAVAAQAAYEHIKQLNEEGIVSEHAWEILSKPMSRQIQARTAAVRQILHSDRSVEISELNNAYREGLRAQRSTYNRLLSSGAINEEIFADLVGEVDTAIINNTVSYVNLLLPRSSDRPPVSRLLTAVVHESDRENAVNMLNLMGIPVTQYESTDHKSSAPVHFLLMGIEAGQEEEIIRALCDTCAEEVEFQPSFIDRFLPAQSSQEIDVDGVTIYVLEVERYEEF